MPVVSLPSRRHAIATAFALSAALPARTALFAQTSELIRIGAGPDDPSVPLLYAEKAGLFAKAGLNVQIVKLAGAAAVAAALSGGSLELGKGAPITVVSAIAKGLPFSVLGSAGYYTLGTMQVGLVVPVNSDIHTAKDLNGKLLAGVTLQDQNVVSTMAWVDQNGGDSSTLHYVEIPASASVAAMEQGRIAASAIYEPQLTTALVSGKVRVVADTYAAVAKRWPIAVLFGNTKWINDHHEAVTKLLNVVAESNAYVAAHEVEMGPLQAEYGGVVDPVIFAKMHHATRDVTIEPSDLQPVLDVAFKYKLFANPLKAADLISPYALRRVPGK